MYCLLKLTGRGNKEDRRGGGLMTSKIGVEQMCRKQSAWRVIERVFGIVGLHGPVLVYEDYGWMDFN